MALPAVPPSGQVPAGVPVAVAAVALDANNQPDPGYSGPATLSITGDTATLLQGATTAALPASVSFVNGVARFLVVFDAPAAGTTDTATLTLTDTTDNLTCSVQVTVGAPVMTAGWPLA